jgi:hypothetical protein
MRRQISVFSCVFALAACEQTSSSATAMSTPDPAEFLLATPDPTFRLAASERASLPLVIDPDALERLLAHVRPEHRRAVLTDLSEIGTKGPVAFGPITTTVPDPAFRAAVQSVFRVSPQKDARP